MSNRFLLEAKNIIKTFPPTVALNDVHFCLRPGEIHGLMGENGSGKSTMCSIVSGIYPYDSGELFLDGEPYCPKNMIDAAAKGVCMIVQEQGTFASTTVAENIFIGKEKQFHNGIRLDTKKMANAAQKILDELQMQHIDARMTCGRLSFEDRKLVEIARAMMKLHAMLSFINHGSNIFVDAVDMTGTYEPLVYSRLKNVYDDAAKFEKYFSKGKPCTDIGIYFNLHGKYDEEMPPMDISESKNISRAIPHLDSSINVSETLQRAHIPYSVYTSFHPEQWGKVKMLIVSDAPNMSKENMSELKTYVEDGGIAYISGHSAQPLVEEIFGGKITGRTDETITYIAPEDEVASLFGEYSRKYPLTVYDSAYILEGATNGKVLAKLTLPYSLQASTFLVCADLELQVEADPNDPRNESASMHSDPPGIATDYPAMMEAEVGKGKIIWVCAPFENTSLTQPRKVFTSFVKKYVPEMRFASDDTPYVVEYQLWEDEEGKYLSAINLQYADEVLPVFDFNICIRTEKPAKITRVSDGREMGFEYSDGKLVLHIDRLDLYEMFDIQI